MAPALTVTGLISTLTAPFGAHTVSMAAITAAICLGPDVHPDKDRRWVIEQVMAAEAPEALGVVQRSMRDLFDPSPRRARRSTMSGE